MAYRYVFGPGATRDLDDLTRHNGAVLAALLASHIPAILADPFGAGEKKKGDLAHVRGYGFTVRSVVYRLTYKVDDDVVTVLSVDTHDEAYAKARRRR